MKSWLRGRGVALGAYLAIAALVFGGLGWVTAAVLQLEEKQWHHDFDVELNNQVSLALWRLDSRVAPALAREESRPFNHYSAFSTPAVAFRNDGKAMEPMQVLIPSPLLNTELPDWMALHFQADPETGWSSPQVLSQNLDHTLKEAKVPVDNITEERSKLCLELAGAYTPQTLAAWCNAPTTMTDTALVPATNPSNPVLAIQQDQQKEPQQTYAPNPAPNQEDYNPLFNQGRVQKQLISRNNDFDNAYRGQQADKVKLEQNKKKIEEADLAWALNNSIQNGANLFTKNPVKSPRGQKVSVSQGAMVPIWLTREGQPERLAIARTVRIGEREVSQGVLLDWTKLQALLAEEVADIFPEATFEPEPNPGPAARTMKWLPIRLNPGPIEAPAVPTWTPLRIGLASAWAAALVALMAVGLGGWSLIDLSERRIRFVSAVTHELRTPLTTLRLYLDMMTGGLVTEPKQQTEYLQTLHGETERLHRLVANVLDFSRLERQRPRLEKTKAPVADLLEEVRGSWDERCKSMEKELVVDNTLAADAAVTTDVKLAQQVLGTLVDNACKYSRGAADPKICLRARMEQRRLVLEVEDHGPGVPARERRSIFRPFRRGKNVHATAGGVGLGLALAKQWSGLLGGSLSVGPGKDGTGACFKLELPG